MTIFVEVGQGSFECFCKPRLRCGDEVLPLLVQQSVHRDLVLRAHEDVTVGHDRNGELHCQSRVVATEILRRVVQLASQIASVVRAQHGVSAAITVRLNDPGDAITGAVRRDSGRRAGKVERLRRLRDRSGGELLGLRVVRERLQAVKLAAEVGRVVPEGGDCPRLRR